MNKAHWLKKPDLFSISLHSASIMNREFSSVFFILGESEKMKLSITPSPGISFSFVFLHTPTDKIVFENNSIKISFFGFESEHNMSKPITRIEIDKNGEEIIFSDGQDMILKIRNSAFFSSSSFGLEIRGEGKAELEVW